MTDDPRDPHERDDRGDQPDQAGAERRVHPRTRLSLVVDYATRDGFIQDYTVNISKGGTMITTRRDLSVGDQVDLQVSFPGLLQPIKLEGEVRWTRREPTGEFSVGVAFDLNDNDSLGRVGELVGRVIDEDPSLVAPTVKLMIVEDNPHVARLIRDGLSAYQQRSKDATSFEIDHAPNGAEALRRLKERNCDLMIVDIYLPVMDGTTMIRAIRRDPRWQGLPIIAVSAGAREARERALAAGADIFLDKPLRLSDVLSTVRRLLAKRPEPSKETG